MRETEDDRLEREYAADPDSPVYTGREPETEEDSPVSGFYDQHGKWVRQGAAPVDPFDMIDRTDEAAAEFERDPQRKGSIGPTPGRPYGGGRQTPACGCECSTGGFCGGCGHAGCRRR